MAIEEAKYTVSTGDGAFEIRDYEPHVVAETLVEGTLEEPQREPERRTGGCGSPLT